jgi:ubiquinone/menaquinone biosynthesis C-methylase UbiE
MTYDYGVMSNALFRGFTPEAMEARCCGRMLERRVKIVKEFLSETPVLGEGLVLEIGAGTGQVMKLVSQDFPRMRFTAVEPVEEYVRYARERYAAENGFLEYHTGTAETLSLPEKSVKAAYSVNIWHHVPLERIQASAQAVARVLRDDGLYFILEPNFRHPYVASYQAWTRGERCFLPWRELKILRECFEVQSVSFYFALPEFIRSVPPWLARAEEGLERCPVLAGSVGYVLRKR